MIWHDHECVEKESSLGAIVEDGSLKQFCGGRHLEKTAALRRGRSDEIRTSLLWCKPHLSRINERHTRCVSGHGFTAS